MDLSRLSLRSRSSTTSSLTLQMGGYKKLCLYIDKATGVLRGDTFGQSDPYVRATVVGGETAGGSTKKTSVLKKTLDPKWKEQLEFWIRGDQFSVILDVFDENKLIKDDFLGRQILHFDFNDSRRRIPVVPRFATGQTVTDVGVRRALSLRDKYATTLLDGYYMPHVAELRTQFFLKRLNGHRLSQANRGRLHLAYVFVDSGEEFEHIQSPTEESPEQATPTQTTPTQTTGEGAANEEESEGEEEPELPPYWEERTMANGRRYYLNHSTRGTSLARPTRETNASAADATPTATPPSQLTRERAFMERHTSIEVIEDRASDDEEEVEFETPPPVDGTTTLHLLDSVSMDTHPHPPSPVHHFRLADTAQPSAPPLEEATSTPQPTAVLQVTQLHPPVRFQLPTAPVQATPTGPVPVPTAPVQATPTGPVPVPTAPVQATPTGPVPVPTAPVQATPTGPVPVPTAPVQATPTGPVQPRPNLGAVAARIPLGAPPQHSLALQREAQSLPSGWQAGMTTDGRIYFINHITKTTTWEKPRLQEKRPQPAPRAAQPAPVEQDSSLPEGWEQRRTAEGRVYYVDHNTHTTSWEHPNSHKEDLDPLPPGWEMKQMADGRLFFVDHTTHSTQWEDPRLLAKNKPTAKMKYSRDYKQKYSNFRQRLPRMRPGAPNFLELPVHRNSLFEDSFRTVTNVHPLSNFHSRLYVKFVGETGLDYGGLAREWFFLLSHEMFSPYYGLFEYAASDDYTLQISPESGVYNEHHLDYFRFIGRMLGLAIYHQHLLDAFFIRPFYKMILSKPVTLDDMQSVDEELYNSVQYILNNDPEPLCLTFSANKTVFGQVLEEELKPGGADIAVTESNRREYINLLIKWRFTDRVQKQMDAIKQGISDIFPLYPLKVFDERELEYLLGGLSSIDAEDWRKNTELIGYSPYDQVIVWFWKAVENYDNEMRARLLQFVTGTSKVPMNGFAELQGSNGPRKFCIKRYGTPNSLPRSHTCFNRIDLPAYASYHKLKENLKLAVENTEGFEGVD